MNKKITDFGLKELKIICCRKTFQNFEEMKLKETKQSPSYKFFIVKMVWLESIDDETEQEIRAN